LWEGLTRHHQALSPYFAGYFAQTTFAQRKADLLAKAETGAMRVEVAKDESSGKAVGYLVSIVHPGSSGELESLFVDPAYRGRGIAETMIANALIWMDGLGVTRKMLLVAAGNESILPYYKRFGFHPRFIVLEA
jgi:ribosomal protein S18 acetylase RimI-like enzyme